MHLWAKSLLASKILWLITIPHLTPVGATSWDVSELLPEEANETGEDSPFSRRLKAAGAPSPAMVDNPAIFKNCLLLISIRTSP
jgi:hypothetical protein